MRRRVQRHRARRGGAGRDPAGLRLFSAAHFAGGQVYESRTNPGYAGSYYCDACLQSVAGVYSVVGVVDRWLCAACGGQKAARRAMAATYSTSAAPEVGNVVTMPSRTPGTTQERPHADAIHYCESV